MLEANVEKRILVYERSELQRAAFLAEVIASIFALSLQYFDGKKGTKGRRLRGSRPEPFSQRVGSTPRAWVIAFAALGVESLRVRKWAQP